MRRITVSLLLAIAGTTAYAQADQKPLNDLPNPYRTVRDWGKPPGGVPWAAVTAVEVSPDGSIYVIHRCKDNSCAGRPEPPILKFDKSGKLLKAWGENMFVFPHGATVDAVADALSDLDVRLVRSDLSDDEETELRAIFTEEEATA